MSVAPISSILVVPAIVNNPPHRARHSYLGVNENIVIFSLCLTIEMSVAPISGIAVVPAIVNNPPHRAQHSHLGVNEIRMIVMQYQASRVSAVERLTDMLPRDSALALA